MAKELLDALESKLLTAVETIESLRREIEGLKEERRLMEDKLRGLIGRIDLVGSDGARPAAPNAVGGEAQRTGSTLGAARANPYRQSDADF